jgi:branched-chain amino acid transport system ATP-binding protein
VSKAAAKKAADADHARRAELLTRPLALETLGLTKRYGGIDAVSDVDLQLHEGQVVGLIGPNGAGKTTIFDLISGFTPSNGGRVILHGTDVTGYNATQRAAFALGRSFQDARLWTSLTVAECLAVAFERHLEIRAALPAVFNLPIVDESEQETARRAEELIEVLGLGAFRDKFIGELSTGSRRMVEIAGILAHRPSVLILDEPSSGIAQKETEALGPLLREVQRYMGCSLLVIEHDMPLITSLADHLYALEEGQVIAFGTPNEVLHHPRVVEAYLGTAAAADESQQLT